MTWYQSARDVFDQGEPCILVTVGNIRGSAPREAGAEMIVFADGFAGTIGGGALEYNATHRARKLAAEGMEGSLSENLILGPDLGQCCGGSVDVTFEKLDDAGFEAIAERHSAAETRLPQVFIFGAGHVGRAIVQALAPLPLCLTCIDDRPDILDQVDDDVRRIPSSGDAANVLGLPSGALVLIMTHSHDLDYDLVHAALTRDDLGYVGLIGSATKRARFLQRLRVDGLTDEDLSRLVCPIGIDGIAGKEPAVIGASVAAQILQVSEAQAAARDDDGLRVVGEET